MLEELLPLVEELLVLELVLIAPLRARSRSNGTSVHESVALDTDEANDPVLCWSGKTEALHDETAFSPAVHAEVENVLQRHPVPLAARQQTPRTPLAIPQGVARVPGEERLQLHVSLARRLPFVGCPKQEMLAATSGPGGSHWQPGDVAL